MEEPLHGLAHPFPGFFPGIGRNPDHRPNLHIPFHPDQPSQMPREIPGSLHVMNNAIHHRLHQPQMQAVFQRILPKQHLRVRRQQVVQ